MNKKFCYLIIVVLLTYNSVYAAQSDISLTNPQNKHNMSSAASHDGPKAQDPALVTGGTDQICVFCHVPHSANNEIEAPLWSRPSNDTTGFPLYGQPLAIKGDIAGREDPTAPDRSEYREGPNYPSGASRLCMSCHDGVTAINILNDNTTIAMVGDWDVIINDPDGLGTYFPVVELTTSHPISFVYNTTVLGDILTAYAPDNFYRLPVGNVDAPLDDQSRMQCTTCHDPHYDRSLNPGDESLPPFWRTSLSITVNSVTLDPYEALCNECHIDGTPGVPDGDHAPGPGI